MIETPLISHSGRNANKLLYADSVFTVTVVADSLEEVGNGKKWPMLCCLTLNFLQFSLVTRDRGNDPVSSGPIEDDKRP